jgi:predicted transcriptional regulator
VRTHVVLPEELVEEIDRLAGPRKRSQFIEEAVRARVEREKLGEALKASAGILKPEDHPEWRTPEDVSAWVRRSRELDNERLEQILKRWEE